MRIRPTARHRPTGDRRTGDRRIGWLALAIGLLGILVVQRASPLLGPPLYDGVIVVEPYRWLVPPAGARGDPKSANGTEQLANGASPETVIATPEQPPQAQIFAIPGALVVPPATTSIALSIVAVLPSTLPADGHIAGNVYRISVTNQAGVPLTAPASAKVTVVLRGPDDAIGATIEHDNAGTWQPLKTEDAGFGATYLAVVTGFGDFALVMPGASASPYPTAPSGVGPGPSSAASAAPGARPSSGGPTGIGSLTPGVSSAGPTVSGSSGAGGSSTGQVTTVIVIAFAFLLIGVGLVGVIVVNRRRAVERRAAARGRRRRR